MIWFAVPPADGPDRRRLVLIQHLAVRSKHSGHIGDRVADSTIGDGAVRGRHIQRTDVVGAEDGRRHGQQVRTAEGTRASRCDSTPSLVAIARDGSWGSAADRRPSLRSAIEEVATTDHRQHVAVPVVDGDDRSARVGGI